VAKIPFKNAVASIRASYKARRVVELDLRPWEFIVQMLCSAYLSWRWLGASAKPKPFTLQYWVWLAQYSSLRELRTRAELAAQTQVERFIQVTPNQRLIQAEPHRFYW